MAVVLTSEDDYFSTTLRRSQSQSKFSAKSSLRSSSSTGRIQDSYSHFARPYSNSTASSSAPSSPRTIQPADSTDISFVSTPSSNISLSSDCDDLQIDFHPDDHFDLEPPPSPKNGHSYTNSPDNDGSGSSTDGPVTPEVVERAEDDTAIQTLNWLKECDVTWLYGPLQTPNVSTGRNADPEAGSSTLSKTDSFIDKKPILKKRSMSEIMLRRSLSSSSLLKQAAAAVQAQEKDARRGYSRPAYDRATTDYVTFPFSSRRESKEQSLFSSMTSSGIASPTSGRKRIHFNEQVEQCIAVDIRPDDGNDTPIDMYGSKVADGKTIAKLPSTTLKDREGTLEIETAMKHSGRTYRSPIVSPSSSQETLRADGVKAKSPKRSFFEDQEDEEESSADASGSTDRPFGDLRKTPSSSSLTGEPSGMRRTASGMFMPCDEVETPAANSGIFGRVLDTVNTARDIAHVIWNVGWRK
ncbi:unnamed protein product [Parascedosporium putredinis]|uniref:Uncharacterized protein n=1 Tax=Parascedosporium putredinis TaxID=1442378 RepID=A0A9P1H3W6_9PEZI|nr:unnamed protein product [Parascedosporium putredinis]CAI7997646.1 unnamed protein product [Parascedosporium putredinis]